MRHLAIGTTLTLLLSASLGLIDQTAAQADEAAPLINTLVSTGSTAAAGESSTPEPATLALEVAADGTLYMADTANHVVRSIDRNGVSTVIAGTGTAGYNGDNQPATEAQLDSPRGLDVTPSGVVYIADTGNHRVRALRPDGRISTVAGTGTPGFDGDGGPARAALFAIPSDVSLDGNGTLYVADTGNDRLRVIEPDGRITTMTDELREPHDVTVAGNGTIYVADTGNHVLRALQPDGAVTTVAGTGNPGYNGDGGPATEAQLMMPSHLAVSDGGTIFLADGHGHRIRKIGSNGQIHTVAGTGVAGYSGDGGPAAQAQLNQPSDVAIGPAALYVVDTGNQVIRVISPVALEPATTTTESTTTSTTAVSTTTVTEATPTTAAPPPSAPTNAHQVAMATPDPTHPPPSEPPPPDTVDELSAQPIASVASEVDRRGLRTSTERNHRHLAALGLGLISLGTLVLALRRTPRVVPSAND